ncbi:uncharacterized protein [Aegilops tauschii subsp. strangulata]|uniref:uncharacterized protein n=1 Tax=Aegilops tauschii subsp. strangulata TaxID=200361 RepID=UPI000989D0D9|nr:ethylene-responsive transcription factor ERF110-like [Aegilops tauschii subsp. strangulata]
MGHLRGFSLPSSSPLSVPLRRRALLPRLQRTAAASRAAAIPPRTRSSSSYRGVHTHPSGVHYVEISSDDTRLRLGTFKTTHETIRAYDAAAWRLRRPRAQMNFSDARTRQQAQDLAPPPWLVTEEDHRIQRRRECRLLIAEADEHAMVVWRERFPEDFATKNEF